MLVTSFDIFLISGLSGVGLYLGAYALLQLGFIRGNGYLYPAMNMVAAGCILFSLTRDFNLSSALIQVSFITISVAGITRLYFIKNHIEFTGDGRVLVETRLPDLDKDIAKRFLDAGEWLDVPAFANLVREDQKTTYLYFLAEGLGKVTRKGKTFAFCHQGDFIGEATCFNEHLPTAAVATNTDSRLFRVETARLQALCKKYPALRTALEKAVAENLREKLARSNGADWNLPENSGQQGTAGEIWPNAAWMIL